MTVLLVTYQLKNPSKDYKDFYEALKSAPKWWHYLDSTWLIVTEETPKIWYNKIESKIEKGKDSVLFIEVENNYYGLLPRNSWDWIKENLGSPKDV